MMAFNRTPARRREGSPAVDTILSAILIGFIFYMVIYVTKDM
jgi:hypothetical protein